MKFIAFYDAEGYHCVSKLYIKNVHLIKDDSKITVELEETEDKVLTLKYENYDDAILAYSDIVCQLKEG